MKQCIIPGIVYHNPYPNAFLWNLDSFARLLMRPYKIFLDCFLSCFFPTTKELAKPYLLIHVYLIFAPVYFILMVCCIPIASIGYLVWLCIHQLRERYRYSQSFPLISHTKESEFTFTTTNLCLLPECFSRFNNLSRTSWRASEEGRVIAQAQLHQTGKNHPVQNGFITKNVKKHLIQNGNSLLDTKGMDTDVVSHFPNTDFLLIQEGSWDIVLAETLAKQLHRAYAHVIYDIASHSFTGNVTVATSGLMFASKYPILSIEFKTYKESCKQCMLASKGLLQVKVSIEILITCLPYHFQCAVLCTPYSYLTLN